MPSIELHQLKTYVLSNFSKKQGCYTTLIEVFINNKLYYNIMLKMDMVAPEENAFLTAEEKTLCDIMQISDRKVQKQQCEELVDAYVKKKILQEVKKPSVPQNSFQQPIPKDKTTGAKKPSNSVSPTQKPVKKQVREKPPKLKGTFYCVNDLCELKRINMIYVRNKVTGEKIAFPKLKCPRCNRPYTVLKKSKDLALIELNGVQYTNLTTEMNGQRIQSIRHLQGKCNCCICERDMPVRCIKCYGKIQEVTVLLKKRQESKKSKRCAHFNIVHDAECIISKIDQFIRNINLCGTQSENLNYAKLLRKTITRRKSSSYYRLNETCGNRRKSFCTVNIRGKKRKFLFYRFMRKGKNRKPEKKVLKTKLPCKILLFAGQLLDAYISSMN